jgi:hypothetical protein
MSLVRDDFLLMHAGGDVTDDIVGAVSRMSIPDLDVSQVSQ